MVQMGVENHCCHVLKQEREKEREGSTSDGEGGWYPNVTQRIYLQDLKRRQKVQVQMLKSGEVWEQKRVAFLFLSLLFFKPEAMPSPEREIAGVLRGNDEGEIRDMRRGRGDS